MIFETVLATAHCLFFLKIQKSDFVVKQKERTDIFFFARKEKGYEGDVLSFFLIKAKK